MLPAADLLNKYNTPVPRYTSYPTVPYWNSEIDAPRWEANFRQRFEEANLKEGISLYIHLPFCESMCTFCGCNKKITTNHTVEKEYVETIVREWEMYLKIMGHSPIIREIHLGGGTPTFFSAEHLYSLIASILEKSKIHADKNFSLEAHPNNSTHAHLKELNRLGFHRISYGIQDNDPVVQRLINRIQPFENVIQATRMARDSGYESINFDLIYGLPLQSMESIRQTFEQCVALMPERLAFYSYAHVPWTSRGQRLFDETQLPGPVQKNQLYALGKKILLEHGYQDIGMDHFALKVDDLYRAWKDGTLSRNFMGYTAHFTSVMLGLGVSAISDIGTAYIQNVKSLREYYTAVHNGNIPIERGYWLSSEDQQFRKHIQDVSCRGETHFNMTYKDSLEAFTFPELRRLETDGLLECDGESLRVSTVGRNFIRNICRAFDLHLLRGQASTTNNIYSKAI
ncbi:MAG: oxygen-independent coproporphyrinogen III oxidase [Chitinophagales bacterium]